jgi:hypothetical protein
MEDGYGSALLEIWYQFVGTMKLFFTWNQMVDGIDNICICVINFNAKLLRCFEVSCFLAFGLHLKFHNAHSNLDRHQLQIVSLCLHGFCLEIESK